MPLTGGTFTGPTINGSLLPGASADWQTVLPDGTAQGDIRYTSSTGLRSSSESPGGTSTAVCVITIPHATCMSSRRIAPRLERHRIFRDWLRSHPDGRLLYAAAKFAAAEHTRQVGGHGMDYNARKEQVVREIYHRAFRALGLLA